MNHSLQDSRTIGLLSRVREDIAHLRQDMGNLIQHTTRQTLPQGARELAENARHQFAAGSSYAASRLRSLGASPQRQAIGVLGGAILIGALAAGLYALCRSESCALRREVEEE
jgi:sensor c-di-GMP phosphodiesterase-like protein